jgi:tRNA(fMet)-specific endonuclease VapC
MFALDTNTLIYFFMGSGRVAERLLATAPTEIVIPAISVYEIETGIAKSREPGKRRKRRKQFDQLLELVAVLPFDRAAANHAAAVRAVLEDTGQPIGPLDTLIAGTVLAHNATLVTRNLREFERVPKLLLVNWFD